MDKKIEKKVEQEVRKRLRDRAREHASRFGKEFKKHILTAVSAALGFLIALSWRTPIKNSIDALIEKLGLSESVIYMEFLSAILITIIAILLLMLISKWSSEK